MSIRKNEDIRDRLIRELEEAFVQVARRSIAEIPSEEEGREFDSLNENIKNSIRTSSRIQAETIASGITEGIDKLRQRINQNIDRIDELERRVEELSVTTTTVTP